MREGYWLSAGRGSRLTRQLRQKFDGCPLEAALAVSPRLRADEIRIPILLIHGARDDIVPIEQSRIMERALRKARKNVRMITEELEGHHFWEYETELATLNEIVAFFRPNLAPQEKAQ